MANYKITARLSDANRDAIIKMSRAGLTTKDIAEILKVSETCVLFHVKNFARFERGEYELVRKASDAQNNESFQKWICSRFGLDHETIFSVSEQNPPEPTPEPTPEPEPTQSPEGSPELVPAIGGALAQIGRGMDALANAISILGSSVEEIKALLEARQAREEGACKDLLDTINTDADLICDRLKAGNDILGAIKMQTKKKGWQGQG